MRDQGIFIVTQPKSSHPSPKQSVRFVLIGLQNRETRRYIIHCKLEVFLIIYSKCELAHNSIRFFISTRIRKHNANHLVTSSLLSETAEQIKNG